MPDSGSLEVAVTVKPPVLPCLKYTVPPVWYAFERALKPSVGVVGSLVSTLTTFVDV